MSELFLRHYGVKGQKKGKRRYQNPDGSLTALGHARYENIRKELEKTYPGWEELKTMNDKELSMVYDGLIKRNDKMDQKIAEYYPNLDVKSLSYEKKRSLYKDIQNGEKMKNEELKHSIDNGLSMVYAILGEEDHLEHYNHNHDGLGRFASSPGGVKYEKKLDKLQSKIDKNNASIEGYKKKINPKKQLKADKLRAKSGKYAKAEAKYQKKALKGKKASVSIQRKHDKYANLNAKADLKDAKNVKWNSKISELEINNQKTQMKIDKILNKMDNKALKEEIKSNKEIVDNFNNQLKKHGKEPMPIESFIETKKAQAAKESKSYKEYLEKLQDITKEEYDNYLKKYDND